MFIPRLLEVVRQCVSKCALSWFTRTSELASALILHGRRQARLEECRVSTIMTEAETSAVSQVFISRKERALPVKQSLRRRLNVYWIERTNKFCLITMAKLIPNKWFWPAAEAHLVSVVKRCCRYPLLYNSCFIFPLLITCLRKSMLNSQKIAH